MSSNKILLTVMPPTWPNTPPIGLGYLQSFLEQKGIGADLTDFNHRCFTLSDNQLQKDWRGSCNTFLEENILFLMRQNNHEKFHDAIEKMLNYDVIGFSCFKSNFHTTLSMAELLKSKKKTLKVVFGGPEVSRQFFKTDGRFNNVTLQAADFLIVGEGEIPLYQYLTGRTAHRKIAIFEQLQDLTDLTFPRYTGIDLNAYPRKYTIPLQFSRGCIRRCNFCSERLLYKNFRTRSVSSIIEEIRYHKTHNETQHFVFYDSLINADLKKLDALCGSIIDHFGAVRWEAQIAIRNDMDKGLMKKMKLSGCYSLFVGLESASNTILTKMNKGFTTEDALKFFNALHQANLFFGVSIMVGYPAETDEDFQNTLDFIVLHKDIIPQVAQINPFTYYDGTSADETADYRANPIALKRMEILVREIKRHKIKHTNAFIGNLIKK